MIFTETKLKGAYVIEPEKLEDNAASLPVPGTVKSSRSAVSTRGWCRPTSRSTRQRV